MKLKGYTQRKLAEALDMSEPSVSKWLNGKVNMTLSQFVRVAEILETTPESLLLILLNSICRSDIKKPLNWQLAWMLEHLMPG